MTNQQRADQAMSVRLSLIEQFQWDRDKADRRVGEMYKWITADKNMFRDAQQVAAEIADVESRYGE